MDQLFVAFEFTLFGALLAGAVGWLMFGRRPEPQPASVRPRAQSEPEVGKVRLDVTTGTPSHALELARLVEAISRKSGVESAKVAQVVHAALSLDREINVARAGREGVNGATPALSAAFDALYASLGQKNGPAESLPQTKPEPQVAARGIPDNTRQGSPLAPGPGQPGGALAPLILVVDDSITVRVFAQRLLRAAGYRVVLAEDGLQALDRLKQERPSVVLADIEMPRMDGFDLARHIRADSELASLPIIMITSRIAHKHREYARQIGVNHYLGKPYAPDEMIQLVRRYATADSPVPA